MRRNVLALGLLFALGGLAGAASAGGAEEVTYCGGGPPYWCGGTSERCAGECWNFPCGSDLCVDIYGTGIGISCSVCVT